MTTLYWLIGRRIIESEQSGTVRASYGEELVERLSADLSARYHYCDTSSPRLREKRFRAV